MFHRLGEKAVLAYILAQFLTPTGPRRGEQVRPIIIATRIESSESYSSWLMTTP